MENNRSTIVSLDPSSTVVGYAVMRTDGRLVQAGPITPEDKKAGSFERVQSLGDDIWSLLERHQPDIILIEWTVGKVGQRRHQGGGAGLSVYGCGVGWIGCVCNTWISAGTWCALQMPRLIAILENDWTRGVPKEDRQAAVFAAYPQYDPAEDPGGDVADAIDMALWWLREQKILDL